MCAAFGFMPVVFRARYTLQATCTGTGREHLSLAAGYLPPEVRSTECVAERGFAASSESGRTRRSSKTRGRIYRVGTMRRFYLVAVLLASVGCERIEPDEAQSAAASVGGDAGAYQGTCPGRRDPDVAGRPARHGGAVVGGRRPSRCGEKIRRRAAVMRSTTVLRAGRLPISPARLLKARSTAPAIPIVRKPLSPKVRA